MSGPRFLIPLGQSPCAIKKLEVVRTGVDSQTIGHIGERCSTVLLGYCDKSLIVAILAM